MAKKRTIELTKDDFRTVWWINDKDKKLIDVDVFYQTEDKPLLQWQFDKAGGNALNGNAAIYLEQVILYAQKELEKRNTPGEAQELM